MATLADLIARRDQLEAQFDRLSDEELSIYQRQTAVRQARDAGTLSRSDANAQLIALDDRLRQITAEKSQISPQLSSLEVQIARAESTGATTADPPRQSSGQTTQEQQQANAEGADPQSPNIAPQSVTATGQVGPTPPSTVGTNAFLSGEEEDASVNAGLNDPVRTATNVQSSPVAAPGGINAANTATGTPNYSHDDVAGISSGATASGVAAPRSGSPAAPGDDQFNAVKTQINDYFGGPGKVIIPQSNVLDKFASYTYNVSIYIMNPQQYRQMLTTKQRNVAGFQLLMSSGGAPIAGGALTPVDAQESQQAADGNSAAVAQPTLGRNQFFPLDYYLDDIQLKSMVSGKATGGAHNVFEMSFKIIEPNGITLLDNLYAATQQYAALQGSTGTQNYAAQMYLMVIRFYGYDADGNIINIKGQVKNPDGSVGPEAVIEKFVPFVFSEIKFRIANKLTEYECKAFCPQNMINTGQGRGVIPYNVEFTATNLRELLTGNLTLKSANQTADQGRAQPASNTPAVAATRANANNQLPAVGTNNDIDNSNVPYAETPAGYIGLTNSAATAAASGPVIAGNSPTQSTAPPKASAAPKPTQFTGMCDALNKYQSEQVAAGKQSLADIYEIQIIDQVLQDARLQPQPTAGTPTNFRSTAMTPQTSAAEQKDGKKQSANSQSKNADAVAGTSIVKFIDMAVRNSSYIYDQQVKIPTLNPKTGEEIDQPNGGAADVLAWYRIGTEAEPIGYDRLRNDYAYKIKYQISLYQVNGVKSDYFPPSKFPGAHKKYNYWFTGENNSIINLEQDFNYLYYVVVNSRRNPAARSATRTSDYREYEKYLVQTRSNQSDQGQPGKINEPGANAADYLYSPADQSRIKMTIVGDPAWLQQGELAFGLSGRSLYQGPFLNDGTINFERQEVLFEVAFNKVVDYDLNTGLMDPGQKNYEANRAAGQAGSARQSYIYKAVEVTSNFSRGRFTQELQGVLVTFDIKPKDAASTSAASFDSFRGGEAEDAAADAGTRTPPINTTPASVVTRNNATNTGTGGGDQVSFPTTDLGRNLTSQAAPFLRVSPVPNIDPQAPPDFPTSAGDIVGPLPNTSIITNAQSGGTTTRPVSTQIVLKSGTSRTVTSDAEVNELYSQGLATVQEAGAAIYRLNGQNAAQQAPVTTAEPQLTDREP